MKKAGVDESLLAAVRPGDNENLEVFEEVKKQLWLAGPLIAGALLQNVIQMVSVMYVGHLGELPLAGASMANSFASVTGLSVLLGMASALDTLCGQAYGGRRYNLLGIYKQRAMVLLTLVSVPLAVVWFYTGEILLLFGQDADIAAEAGTYARWMIPALFAYGPLQCHIRFLQTQNIVQPVMASAGAAAACHLFVCWLLVYALGMGSKGAALSNAIAYWVNVGVLAVYVRVSRACKETWTGFSTEAFRDALSFFSLEMWSFELVVLLSGLLPNPKLETSVLSISLNTSAFVWMIPFGLSCAISTRVSNELGAGRSRAARLAARVVLLLAVSEGLMVGLILVCVRYIWGHAYSDLEEVVSYVARMMLVIAVTIFFDGIMTVLSGVARGCGWQKIGACINLGAYYIVGIPSAYLLGFVLSLGGMGLWMGINCGLLVQLLLLMIVTLCTNWDKEPRPMDQRNGHGLAARVEHKDMVDLAAWWSSRQWRRGGPVLCSRSGSTREGEAARGGSTAWWRWRPPWLAEAATDERPQSGGGGRAPTLDGLGGPLDGLGGPV